jgi:xylose isomerase
LAARFDARHVVLWMADDGWDYPLQVDYARLWDAEVSAVRLVADRNPDVSSKHRVQAVEPRRRSLIGSMGEALLAAREVDRPNVGVTLDFCHSVMAGESPAAAARLPSDTTGYSVSI